MDAAQVGMKLELSADEDFILTAWQYRMMQRDVAASKGRQLAAKRVLRNEFRAAAVDAVAQRTGEIGRPRWRRSSTGSSPQARPQISRHSRTRGRRSPRSCRGGREPSCSSSTCTASNRGPKASGTKAL